MEYKILLITIIIIIIDTKEQTQFQHVYSNNVDSILLSLSEQKSRGVFFSLFIKIILAPAFTNIQATGSLSSSHAA